MIKVKNIILTCIACPAQWEGITEDNCIVYIRYRHGKLRIHKGLPGYDIKDTLKSDRIIFEKTLTTEDDGWLDYEDLKIIAKDLLELPEIEDVFSEDTHI